MTVARRARAIACGLLLAIASVTAAQQAAPASARHLEDFDAMWRAIDERYAYFEDLKAAWRRAREAWRPKAAAARSRPELIAALEGALAHLRDDHVTLSERTPASPRRIPSEADIWVTWRSGGATVTAIRPYSDADVAGVHPGHVITKVQGVDIQRAARERLGNAAPTAATFDWALRQLVAGPRNGSLRLHVSDGGTPAILDVEHGVSRPEGGGLPLVARRVGDERDVGYIRIKNTLGDPKLPEQFDGALNYLKDTRMLILDLRETQDGGRRDVMLAILGRFVQAPAPWQLREAPGKGRVADTVAPRGNDAYRKPLLVLVDRWTAGEGEALAAGLEAVARATLVGTAMAGLKGELGEARLPHSGIAVRFPAERTFHVNGTPRERLRPGFEVDLIAPKGGPGDPILYEALKLASRKNG